MQYQEASDRLYRAHSEAWGWHFSLREILQVPFLFSSHQLQVLDSHTGHSLFLL